MISVCVSFMAINPCYWGGSASEGVVPDSLERGMEKERDKKKGK